SQLYGGPGQNGLKALPSRIWGSDPARPDALASDRRPAELQMALQLPATAEDYRRLARARLPRFLFDYVDGGANDEKTIEANLAGWAEITLRHRVLASVDRVDTAAIMAGQPC